MRLPLARLKLRGFYSFRASVKRSAPEDLEDIRLLEAPGLAGAGRGYGWIAKPRAAPHGRGCSSR